MIYSDQNPFESNRIQPPLLKFPLEFRAAPRLTENADATTRRRFLFLYTVAKELITPPHFGLVSAVSDLINSILGLRSLLIAFFSKCLLIRARDIGLGYERVAVGQVSATASPYPQYRCVSLLHIVPIFLETPANETRICCKGTHEMH